MINSITTSMYRLVFYKLERCEKPIIAAIHSGCVGEGINLITATDIRHCTDDAWFSLKHIDISLHVNVRRLPKVIQNHSQLSDMGVVSKVR